MIIASCPCLKRAISLYEQSREVYTRQTFAFEWARGMNHLAYRERIRGERASNIYRAISLYEQSLVVYTCDAFPYKWATNMNNLAAAYYSNPK